MLWKPVILCHTDQRTWQRNKWEKIYFSITVFIVLGHREQEATLTKSSHRWGFTCSAYRKFIYPQKHHAYPVQLGKELCRYSFRKTQLKLYTGFAQASPTPDWMCACYRPFPCDGSNIKTLTSFNILRNNCFMIPPVGKQGESSNKEMDTIY